MRIYKIGVIGVQLTDEQILLFEQEFPCVDSLEDDSLEVTFEATLVKDKETFYNPEFDNLDFYINYIIAPDGTQFTKEMIEFVREYCEDSIFQYMNKKEI